MELNCKLLEGKVAIVTGCNRGIGNSIMELFASHGAIVYAVARQEGSLDNYENSRIVPCYFDVTDKTEIKNLIQRIKKEQGKLDVLVNNAGVMQDALIGMVTEEQINNTFAVNVFAPMYFIQYATKLMVRQKSGSIINLSSIMGVSGNAGQMVYSSTKGAVIAMTKSCAKELGHNNIRVNAIAPGVVKTNLIESTPEDKMKIFLSKIAMREPASPIEIANATLFLASDLSKYISGQILGVDGMMSN